MVRLALLLVGGAAGLAQQALMQNPEEMLKLVLNEMKAEVKDDKALQDSIDKFALALDKVNDKSAQDVKADGQPAANEELAAAAEDLKKSLKEAVEKDMSQEQKAAFEKTLTSFEQEVKTMENVQTKCLSTPAQCNESGDENKCQQEHMQKQVKCMVETTMPEKSEEMTKFMEVLAKTDNPKEMIEAVQTLFPQMAMPEEMKEFLDKMGKPEEMKEFLDKMGDPKEMIEALQKLFPQMGKPEEMKELLAKMASGNVDPKQPGGMTAEPWKLEQQMTVEQPIQATA